MTYTDLKGKWEVCLDKSKSRQIPENFNLEINLPNTTSNSGLGEINKEKNYGCLTDLYKFEGYAWYRKKIYIPYEQHRKNIILFLERTRKTKVYVDGKKIGEYCSLCTPHRYNLTGVTAGEHELVICVDNTDYPTAGGHLTSKDTQTNWNGITGKIGLYIYKSYPEFVSVYPDLKNMLVKVSCEITGEKSGTAQFRVYDENTEYGKSSVEISSDEPTETVIKLSDKTPLWSEHNPQNLNIEISIGDDMKNIKFGMKEFAAEGLKLKINGRETFMRGKHDGLVFPKTGYAPTDFESWKKIFETAKNYGVNHYRFHTCCPPEAAFEAADCTGVYLQPELPFWGTIPHESNDEFNFLKDEGFRILKEYGHHPSFVMMSMGNELWGDDKMIDSLLEEFKKVSPDKLFTQGSNNFQFVPKILPHDDFFSGVRFSKYRLIRGSYASCDAPFGHIQTDEPNSIHNYDCYFEYGGNAENSDREIMIQYGTEAKKVKADESSAMTPNVPVISHEVGQYYIYPNYNEIKKYTSSLKHDTYCRYKKAAEENGLLPFAVDFFKSSGKLAADCYRREIEAALNSEKMSGFQLLDLQDFPGQGIAAVGILDSFMESKGLIEAEDWRKFCNKTVLLAGFEKFVFSSGENILCKPVISNTDSDFDEDKIEWKITKAGEILKRGTSIIYKSSGRLSYGENIVFGIDCDKPQIIKFELSAGFISNSYTLYIYPEIDVEITENKIRYGERVLKIVRNENECDEKSLCIPVQKENDLNGVYCTDFWCYKMFKSISESMGKPVPVGTLGLLINNKSELLSCFPCEKYTTPQWYNIVVHSFCMNLNRKEIVPDIWVIDNPERASRLALLYRENNKIICSSRLWEIGDKIEVKHFAASLVNAIIK